MDPFRKEEIDFKKKYEAGETFTNEELKDYIADHHLGEYTIESDDGEYFRFICTTGIETDNEEYYEITGRTDDKHRDIFNQPVKVAKITKKVSTFVTDFIRIK